ncbi:hypothetical protein [Acetobacter okinawensis]|uniref:hypothetical protein n=1 Tax=Acetobacter okinawensis TaxID=1076594 RepID=UPI000A6A0C61|nr:hypothetical protein [Acetobacter okinawensis]
MAGLFRLFSSRANRTTHGHNLSRMGCMASILALAACATPEHKTYDMALADARTDPALCQSIRYYPLLAEAWQKATWARMLMRRRHRPPHRAACRTSRLRPPQPCRM